MKALETYTLDNGLTVVLYHDPSRTTVAVNVLYKVGSKNDPPGRSGFAHLFEHLMFSGSKNVPNFDDALQLAGGENNAVTSQDYTVYFDTLPAQNLDTALWLESDRMNQLNFTLKALETQKKVVIEEFKETSIDSPYGDLYHHLNPLIYRNHPYRWPVIGERYEDIQKISLKEVKDFYYKYYRPDNAVLSIAGAFDPTWLKGRIEFWFGDIPPTDSGIERPTFPEEPAQTGLRKKVVVSDVPSPMIYLFYRTPSLLHEDFPTIDGLCFLLGGGRSSLLYRKLVRNGDLFTSISCSLNENTDGGGIFIEACPVHGVDLDEARQVLDQTLREILSAGFSQQELEKVINRIEHGREFKRLSMNAWADEMALYAAIGRPELIGQFQRYLDISTEDLNRVACKYLRSENLNEVIYQCMP